MCFVVRKFANQHLKHLIDNIHPSRSFWHSIQYAQGHVWLNKSIQKYSIVLEKFDRIIDSRIAPGGNSKDSSESNF